MLYAHNGNASASIEVPSAMVFFFSDRYEFINIHPSKRAGRAPFQLPGFDCSIGKQSEKKKFPTFSSCEEGKTLGARCCGRSPNEPRHCHHCYGRVDFSPDDDDALLAFAVILIRVTS